MLIAQCQNTDCGVWFERVRGQPGRPRKYCSDTCRIHTLKTVHQPAYFARKRRANIARGIWI